jgi:hypothetical protein
MSGEQLEPVIENTGRMEFLRSTRKSLLRGFFMPPIRFFAQANSPKQQNKSVVGLTRILTIRSHLPPFLHRGKPTLRRRFSRKFIAAPANISWESLTP